MIRWPIRDKVGNANLNESSVPPTKKDKVPAVAPATPAKENISRHTFSSKPSKALTARDGSVYHLCACFADVRCDFTGNIHI